MISEKIKRAILGFLLVITIAVLIISSLQYAAIPIF